MTKKNVKKELEILKSDFSELMDLFDNSHENSSLISKRYSEIKVQVNERLNFLEKEYKANKLNEIELCFLLPAIREVSLHCTAKIGSKNIEQLSASIYDCEDYSSYWLTALDA